MHVGYTHRRQSPASPEDMLTPHVIFPACRPYETRAFRLFGSTARQREKESSLFKYVSTYIYLNTSPKILRHFARALYNDIKIQIICNQTRLKYFYRTYIFINYIRFNYLFLN